MQFKQPTPSPPPPVWIPLRDAARKLRRPFGEVLALVRANRIRARLAAGRYWIERSELAAARERLKRDRAA